MTSPFTALSANHVDANIQALLHMLRMSDHIHVEDACFMEALDNVHWRHADSGDEKFGTGVDNDGDEVIQFALCIIVAGKVLLE